MKLSGYKSKKFQEGTFQAQKLKKKKHSDKISYILGNGALNPKI